MKKWYLGIIFLPLLTYGFAWSQTVSTTQKVVQTQYGNVLSKTPLTEQVGNLSRLAGYRVVYEYQGKQYAVLMPEDPGTRVLIQSPPNNASSVPTVAMPDPAPVKTPTQAEVASALTPPTTIIMNTPSQIVYAQPSTIYAVPPVTYVPPIYSYPYYPYYGPYYRPYPFAPLGLGIGLHFRVR